ncbi:YebW family protein [Shimwellia blattae]|uniref:Uncharacterized protein n=1 Tax=Shimwellia blattae (strain ATCC 29907 / DSM 4481 / JCM 1650 / NBRC 105725 / CDC 9005-74) TaxID=630626 RepID=I2B8H8_SHIBC|nr:YebW family protein [Shimwellia blattae]AFJ46832.1 hypothetical protein EBL_c17380 [Shimwellia blattae DSM 4481 = NBRC 105725]GAB82972.1 hypothetical protein YebW [Shimwellia blattae DSM 4481 = NBRC 105725]VDY64312.1 Protein of uncharacterised function (DUF1482) [Shimwellia blattae]VEC22436.1 Protein of uncharacterised function (DUF1482) [Shimwellia blattae]
MYTLVLFVCWLNAGCQNLPIDNYPSEARCLASMEDQQIRNGGCYPTVEVRGQYWRPATEYSDL